MNALEAVEVFAKRKARQYSPGYLSRRDLNRLAAKDFVLISKNCWGGQVYRHLNLPYNTPFVGLFLMAPDYLKLLRRFDYYMAQPLEFVPVSRYRTGLSEKYPIGVLDDIEIHFQHYENEVEATEKWNRRKKRMLENKNTDRFFFTMCDRRECTPGMLRAFHQLPFKNKLSFGVDRIDGLTPLEHIRVQHWPPGKRKYVRNGKKLFKLTFLYVDLVHWLNTGNVRRTRFKT